MTVAVNIVTVAFRGVWRETETHAKMCAHDSANTARTLAEGRMRQRVHRVAAVSVLAIGCAAVVGRAQTAPAVQGTPASSSIVVASPTYTSILLEVAVSRPAADVWKRVGKFC